MGKAFHQTSNRETNAGIGVGTSVYLVEDSDSIRTRLADMLGEIDGIRVVGEAKTAMSAITGILHARPDAVVLDIQLSGSSGLDVLRQVHPLAPAIIFIVLTNYPNAQYRRSCLLAGASYFLDKTSEFGKVADLLLPAGAIRSITDPHLNALNLSNP